MGLLITNPVLPADLQQGLIAYEEGDFVAALKELKPLAEQGDAMPQNYLGLMYDTEQGVPKDSTIAIKWYTLAAKQGDTTAQERLKAGRSLDFVKSALPVRASDVLSAVSGYQSSVYARVILVERVEVADLYIFTSPNDALQQAVYAPDIVFTGLGGVDAYLAQTLDGPLQLISQNIANGSSRWQQTLTIVYRDNQFLVGGYTYSSHNLWERDSNGEVINRECDLNFLTGSGIKDGQPIRTSMKAIPVQDWSIEISPPGCASN